MDVLPNTFIIAFIFLIKRGIIRIFFFFFLDFDIYRFAICIQFLLFSREKRMKMREDYIDCIIVASISREERDKSENETKMQGTIWTL